MNVQQFYDLMYGMHKLNDYNEIKEAWYKCFGYALQTFCPEYTDNVIKSLFEGFVMQNWIAMHKANTEYADYSEIKLQESFKWECSYIADRISYDRLFRCHWLYLRAFVD